MDYPKSIKQNFSEKEMVELATNKPEWAGIAKIAKIEIDFEDYGPHYDYRRWWTDVTLEIQEDGKDKQYNLHYSDRYDYDGRCPKEYFVEGTNIAFVGTKTEHGLQLTMIGEPADLEAIQEKVNAAIENGTTILKIEKIKEQLQSAGDILLKPLKAAFTELKKNWEESKKARELAEKARIAAEKADREAKNNRPTGIYARPEEQTRDNNISK